MVTNKTTELAKDILLAVLANSKVSDEKPIKEVIDNCFNTAELFIQEAERRSYTRR